MNEAVFGLEKEGSKNIPAMYANSFIDEYKELIDSIHAYKANIILQLDVSAPMSWVILEFVLYLDQAQWQISITELCRKK